MHHRAGVTTRIKVAIKLVHVQESWEHWYERIATARSGRCRSDQDLAFQVTPGSLNLWHARDATAANREKE